VTTIDRTHFVIPLLLLAFLGCSSKQDRAKENLLLGLKAFQEGDVFGSYRLLRSEDVTQTGRLPTGYTELLQQVTQATEYLIERWLEKGDAWAKQGNLIQSLRYYSDLARSLPPGDPLRAKFQKKAIELDFALDSFRYTRDQLLIQAQKEISQGQYASARAHLIAAREQAQKVNLAFAVRNERLLEECNRRLPPQPDPQTKAVEPAPRVEKPGEGAAAAETPERKVSPEPATAVVHEDPVRVFLNKARGHMQRKEFPEAILAVRKVLSIAPLNVEAADLMQKLEPAQKELVSDYMKKASAFSAKEDLESAVPFYRKVLELEPDNLRAKEGLQMYERLKKLKEGNKKPAHQTELLTK
jgi:tetratricopeptide (TPR) repeat protein